MLSQFQIHDILAHVGWVSSLQCHSILPPATKNHQADYPPATYWPYMVNIKLHLYFPGWVGVGVVIIKLKANLSSTSHLTSQLELSLAKSIKTLEINSRIDWIMKKQSGKKQGLKNVIIIQGKSGKVSNSFSTGTAQDPLISYSIRGC